MALREREWAAPGANHDAPAPPAPSPGRLRPVVALAAAVAALVAFTALARPESSSSARLSIGEPEEVDVRGEAERRPSAAVARPTPFQQSRPLDPATLADVPANILTVGRHTTLVPSHDGTLLAVLEPGDEAGEVAIVDAKTFQPVARVTIEPTYGPIVFAPEGDAIVVSGWGEGGENLTRHPLDPAEPTTSIDLPADVVVAGAWTPLSEGRVAALATARDPSDRQGWTGTARVLVADLLSGRLAVDLPLPGLAPGLFVGDPTEADGGVATYAPGTGWDVERERLYVLSGDATRVTVVDLAAGTVLAEGEVGSGPGPATEEPVHRWWDASVSPDGSRLFVGGWAMDPAEAAAGRGGWGTSLGLSVVDTATLSEVGDVGGVNDWFLLSPDGRWLSWTERVAPDGTRDDEGAFARVGLLDTRTLAPAALPGNGSLSSHGLGFSRDSTYFYVSEDGGQPVVRAYDLRTLTQSGQRHLPRDSWFEPLSGLLHESGWR